MGVCSWVPVSAKSRSLGLAYSAGQIGNIVALITSPLIINHYGWKSAFWLYGTLGLTWMLAWVPLVPDQPPNKTRAARQLGGVSCYLLEKQFLCCVAVDFTVLLSRLHDLMFRQNVLPVAAVLLVCLLCGEHVHPWVHITCLSCNASQASKYLHCQRTNTSACRRQSNPTLIALRLES